MSVDTSCSGVDPARDGGVKTMSREMIAQIFAGAMALFFSALCVAAAPNDYQSPQAALDQGISAFSNGYYEVAIPALEHAAEAKLFLAPYYLARIYSDNNGSHVDHAKAFELYLRVAEEHADVDPDDDQCAPYVAKAMTQIAGYLETGLPEAGVKPSSRR
jgi:uncharacterized protein